MPAAWVSAGAAVIGVANSMGAFGSPSGSGGGGGAGGGMTYGQYDPYGNIGGRTDAANKLQTLTNDPSSALSQPGYQLGMSQGTSALTAQGAAKGTIQSGGQSAALQGYGQNYFQTAYNNLFNQYGALSGATTQTPGGAASQYSNASTQGNQLSYNMLQGQSANILGLGGYLSGLASNFGGGGSPDTGAGTGMWGNTSGGFGSGFNLNAGGASSPGGAYAPDFMTA